MFTKCVLPKGIFYNIYSCGPAIIVAIDILRPFLYKFHT